jgi:DNA-binding winged helix-turn-helix (wHTH) protein/TolB-like protein/Flp pilus assembly protein TadD
METAEDKGFVYEFGKFTLDPGGKTLFADGEMLRIPAKEFETLLFLVEHNGRAMSKEEMMSAIWQDAFVEEGNLAKQISRLRKILNTKGEEFIETIPKHGYRFSADLRRTAAAIESPIIVERRTVQRLRVAYDAEPAVKALPAHPSRFITWQKAAVVGAVALLATTAWFLFRPSGGHSINTIAVLPLRPLGGDESGKALGLGLTDALITKLGSLKRIVIRPTNAVAAIPAEEDPTDIGRRLHVDAILDGTIQEADGRLRINARLLRTSTGEQIWGDRFEEPAGGIFALQDALSSNIAKALAFELNKSDTDQLAHRGTENSEAYEMYLRGRFYQSQNTPEGFNKSLDLYKQASALDPNFADAYAGIADSNLLLFNFGFVNKEKTIPFAREAVDRALRLDPNLSNAYTSNALIQFLIDRNWPEAEKSLLRAIDLNPNSADAFVRYGYFLINVGRFDDALAKLEKARELNPLSPIVSSDIGLAYLGARHYRQATEQLEKATAENPRFSLPFWLLGTTYEAMGEAEKAFEINLQAFQIDGGDEEFQSRLRQIKDKEGIDAANRIWFEETVKSTNAGRETALITASRAAVVKDREQTLIWLEKAAEEDDAGLAQIKFLEKFDFVRDEPRFQAVVDKLPV